MALCLFESSSVPRSAPSLTRTGPTVVNSFGWYYGAPYGGGFGAPVVATGGGGGGGLITILVLGVMAAFLFSTLSGAGDEGGKVVATGLPADIARHPSSRTGPYLKCH